jgi:hypothetical protein
MDTGKRLSLREQRILTEIEEMLRRDRKLDDRLRNLRLPTRFRLLSAQRRLRGIELGLLIPTTLVLSLSAAHTQKLGVIIACCCVGAITLALIADAIRSKLVRRRLDRLAQSRAWRQTSP